MRKKIVLLLVMLHLIVGCNKKESDNSENYYSYLSGTYINEDSQSKFIFDESDIGTMSLYEVEEKFSITYENDTNYLINDGEDGYLTFSSDFNSFEWHKENAGYSLSYVKE